MLFSRTQVHQQNFADALSVADADVVLAAVHGDREDPIPGVDSDGIVARMQVPPDSTATVVPDLREAAAAAASLAKSGDTVLTVGSGTVTQAAQWIVDALKAREGGGDG
jgi:UDP-N-acetylmuramate--alanine ligase